MSGPVKFWGSLIVCGAALIWGLRWAGGGDGSGPSVERGSLREAAGVTAVARPPSREAAARSKARDSHADEVSTAAMAGTPAESPVDIDASAGLTTVQQIASEIGGQAPGLVILFSTECPRSQGMFPAFVELTDGLSDDTTVMAYSTLEADAARLPDFLSTYGASFGATPIQRWAPGEMTDAMGEVGIRIGPEFALTLVAVVGEGGAVLGQWQGVTDLTAVRQALASGGMLR